MTTPIYNSSHLRRARAILFGDERADDTDEDSGPWLVRPVDLARHLAAGEAAWRIMYQHESRWANLPTSEREAALKKALESTTADQIKAEDEVERLRLENWQLKGALGYPVPGDIPPGNFKCGLCEARALR